MPKSVLRFELDKDSTSIWKLPLTPILFPNYCMAAVQLVSACTEEVPDKFSGEERLEHDIFIQLALEETKKKF